TETENTGTTGPVNIINTDEEINIGAGDKTIKGTGIILNGGETQLSISTTNDDIRFNGAITLKSDVGITTGSGAGNINFTANSPIESELGEYNNLTAEAGMGDIYFKANIGAGESLGELIISNAAQVIIFEESHAKKTDITAQNLYLDGATTYSAELTKTDIAENLVINTDLISGDSMELATRDLYLMSSGIIEATNNIDINAAGSVIEAAYDKPESGQLMISHPFLKNPGICTEEIVWYDTETYYTTIAVQVDQIGWIDPATETEYEAGIAGNPV
ncbi:MAG: hypothetical protein GY869_24425, partial [Planctomycetes bacterium]|nr:hypothetical protein [Planctomycetota bacterium]